MDGQIVTVFRDEGLHAEFKRGEKRRAAMEREIMFGSSWGVYVTQAMIDAMPPDMRAKMLRLKYRHRMDSRRPRHTPRRINGRLTPRR